MMDQPRRVKLQNFRFQHLPVIYFPVRREGVWCLLVHAPDLNFHSFFLPTLLFFYRFFVFFYSLLPSSSSQGCQVCLIETNLEPVFTENWQKDIDICGLWFSVFLTFLIEALLLFVKPVLTK